MTLTREIVLEALVNALLEAQEDLVEEPEHIDEDTRPIGDLQQFDSLTSVVVTLHCLTTLGIEDLPSFPTLFINNRGDALTVGEVVNRIMTMAKKLTKKKVIHHAE